jgi:FtsH-binding integral membrane protein
VPNKHLFIVRIALLAGVLAFAALATYQRAQQADTLPTVTLPLDTMRYVLWALAAAAAGAALFLKARAESAAPAQRALMTLIGWSFGEGVALFGIVQHYTGAAMSTMALGLLTFVFTLMVLPVPRDGA